MDLIILGIIVLVVSIIVLIESLISFFKDDMETDDFAWAMVLSSFFIIVSTGCLFDGSKEYGKPHHGEKPTLQDVSEGTAHIDTLIATCDKGPQKQLYINWNDSIIYYVDE